MTEMDLDAGGGRKLHAYDTGERDAALAVFWCHGTPNIGAPPEPLLPAAARLGIRWVSYDRPGYGGSTVRQDRSIGSAAADVSRVADALGIERFAIMGHSGGGPHALACGALLAGRALGVVSAAGIAPFGAEGLDWFAGMCPSGLASLRAAAAGREAKERHEASGVVYDPEFTAADEAALAGPWGWLGRIAARALEGGRGGLIEDDLAYVRPWGCDPADVAAPVLLLHGERDRVIPSSHSRWLSRRCPSAELRLFPADGHISILATAGEAALRWLRERAG